MFSNNYVLIFLGCSFINLVNCLDPILINGNYSEPISETLDDSVEYIISYPSTNETKFPRVIVESSDSTKDEPLMIVVRQKKRILSWQIPLIVATDSGPSYFNKSARTICQDITTNKSVHTTDSFETAIQSIIVLKDAPIVSLSTASKSNITFNLTVIEDDFYITPSTQYNISISPAEPRYFFYNFPGNTTEERNFETVVLEVFSSENVCMTVSIQNASCPVYDLNNEIKFDGYYETVDLAGGITISKSKFPHGFFVAFVPKGDDTECAGSVNASSTSNRRKDVRFIIKPSITYSDYINAVLITLFCIAIFYIVFVAGFCFCLRSSYVPRAMEYVEDAEVINTPTTCTEPDILDNISFDETEYDTIAEALSDREMILGRVEIYLSDLARKDPRILKRKSYSYLWHVLTVALFYSLPVVQLVIYYQSVLNETGNQDLCYYNFLCAHPFGFFSDFNHLFSNIGYILFGILFLIITYRREKWHQDLNFDRHYGIPQHYGLYYAMGVALILEGVLSGSYHICPNHSNFQFDTSFMYIIAVLCMIKIYQTRHPDINATAYATFGVLAIAILLGMIGILEANIYFWIGFTILHILICLYLTAQIYYMGCWKLDRGILCRFFNSCKNDYRAGNLQMFRPLYKGRMVLLIFGNIINWLIAGFGTYNHEHDFALHLLAIFMLNTILYFLFYVTMKLLHRERINMQAWIFLILSLSCAASAMYCFLHKSISWALTPAQSRHYNQECKLLRFYDYHDIWHFLSAVGMFFMFMVLLVLDDDLSHTHRSKIPVF